MSKRLKKLKQVLRRKRQGKARMPRFVRPESWRYKRLDTGWRRARGIDSKIRRKHKGFPVMPSIGYRSPSKLRNLHPSGLEEVLVYNVHQLEGLHPKFKAVRIARRVGDRKRLDILDRADELGLHVLNPRMKTRVIEDILTKSGEEL
ncbi:MAG: 50S ribosomal protein L32e [Promethearchaeota archaeon]